MSIDLGRVTGLSAFEVWQKQTGNEGKTVEEFLQSLKGERGEKGQEGQQGIQGQKGDKGERGEQGMKGDKPTITMKINEQGHLIMTVS